jgi:hypothetical protein
MSIEIVRAPITREVLLTAAAPGFGDMIKAVVDLHRRIMAIGGELHSDEEARLIDDGSRQEHLWGINLYPGESEDAWIEFDSMINVRPSQGNRSRDVQDPVVRDSIRDLVHSLVPDGGGR